jgi:hypothetical protein
MQQQLREKLERLHKLAGIVWEGDGGAEVSAELAEMRDLTALMLAEPDRNCDIGTAEEQEHRFSVFCYADADKDCSTCCLNVRDDARCFALWAQMP